MFTINDDLSIYVTRGDVVFFTVTAEENGNPYKFREGDIIRIKITDKKDAESVLFQKTFILEEDTEKVQMHLNGDETRFGDVISKPTDYWYEIELNPFTKPQTIIGYDEDGAKIFRLFPEGDNFEYVEPEDVPVVDAELSLTSERPVQNQAVSRALIYYEERVAEAQERINTTADEAEQRVEEAEVRINTTVNEMEQRADVAQERINATADEAEQRTVDVAIEMIEEAKNSINSTTTNAIDSVDNAEAEALQAVQNATTASEANAKRAEEAADRAEAIVGGDYATNGRVEEISTNVIGWFENAGWYRVAEYPVATVNDAKGIAANSCTLTIKQRYSSKGGDHIELKLLSVFNNQEFVCTASKSATTIKGITRARYTYDSEKAYLEVYYNFTVANQILFEITQGKDKSSLWKTIAPVATDEAVDGVTVTTTYDIPSGVTPVTSVDFNKLITGEEKVAIAKDAETFGGNDENYFAKASELEEHTSNKNNPHDVTKEDVGLGKVDNTSDSEKSVLYAESAGAVAWGNVSGKPSTFSPSSHNHDASNITSGTLPVARGGTGATTAAAARTNLGITPGNIGAAASSHTHTASQITDTVPVTISASAPTSGLWVVPAS